MTLPHAGSGSGLTAYFVRFSHLTVRTLSQFQAVSSSVKIYFGCRGWNRTSGLSGMNRTDYFFPTLRCRLLVDVWVSGLRHKSRTWQFPVTSGGLTSTNTAGDSPRFLSSDEQVNARIPMRVGTGAGSSRPKEQPTTQITDTTGKRSGYCAPADSV